MLTAAGKGQWSFLARSGLHGNRISQSFLFGLRLLSALLPHDGSWALFAGESSPGLKMPQGGVSQPTDRSHASAPLNNNLDNYVDRDGEAVTATSIYIIFLVFTRAI
jgi:hypothetical protein